MASRDYTTKRLSIVNALVEKLKGINGTGSYLTDLNENISPRLKFWDEVEEFPAIHLNAGSETREYQGGGYKIGSFQLHYVAMFRLKMLLQL